MPERIFKRPKLPPRTRGRNHKKVGEVGDRFNIQQHDRLSLALVELIDDRTGETFRISLGCDLPSVRLVRRSGSGGVGSSASHVRQSSLRADMGDRNV